MTTTRFQKRTAKDPYDYVRRLNATYAKFGEPKTASVESIDGETATGQKRYTMRIEVTR